MNNASAAIPMKERFGLCVHKCPMYDKCTELCNDDCERLLALHQDYAGEDLDKATMDLIPARLYRACKKLGLAVKMKQSKFDYLSILHEMGYVNIWMDGEKAEPDQKPDDVIPAGHVPVADPHVVPYEMDALHARAFAVQMSGLTLEEKKVIAEMSMDDLMYLCGGCVEKQDCYEPYRRDCSILAAYIQEAAENIKKKEKQEDVVNEPSHYQHGSFEVIDEMVIVFGMEATIQFCRMNAWKYRARAPYKGKPEEDMAKANRYLEMAYELEQIRQEYGHSEVYELLKGRKMKDNGSC